MERTLNRYKHKIIEPTCIQTLFMSDESEKINIL